MKINKETMLFDEMSAVDAEQLLRETQKLVQLGITSDDLNSRWFKPWCRACGFDERQELFVKSTLFPAKALLSAAQRLCIAWHDEWCNTHPIVL